MRSLSSQKSRVQRYENTAKPVSDGSLIQRKNLNGPETMNIKLTSVNRICLKWDKDLVVQQSISKLIVSFAPMCAYIMGSMIP
jgi:hypothetical protein